MPSGFRKDGTYAGRLFTKGSRPHNSGLRTRRERRPCRFCLREFEAFLSARRVYCSRRCGALSQTIHPRPTPRARTHFRHQLICPECSTAFTCLRLVGRKHQRFCSLQCYGRYRARVYVGDKHPQKGFKMTAAQRLANRERLLHLWRDEPERMRKALTCRTPNTQELKLASSILGLNLPYKFVGDGSFILAGKNPDFVNTNGQKKIIELFGERWHEPAEEQERKDIFAAYGFDTLVIWGRELKNLEALKQKLLDFAHQAHSVEER